MVLWAVLMAACANLGTPDGGPFDEEPPKIIGTSPKFGAVNSKHKKIVLLFNENIKLDNATEKVVISPPQINQPDIDAAGKKITITLNDTLKPGMTYTIDFADAIQDNNEGNPMDDYAFTFSTGEMVDTFQVSGYVLDASNLEPLKGLLVGLYRISEGETDLPDSIFRTREFERVSRTDASGHFVVKGLNQEAQYRVFALKDQDQDFRFSQKAEMLGFNRRIITPSAKPDIRQDTVWHDSIHYDSIIYKPYTHFYPDDIVITAFTEEGQNRAFLKGERPQLEKFTLYFTAPDSMMPVIKGLNFNEKDAFVIDANERKDTLTYWVRDSLVYNNDTLSFLMTYNYTDTLNQLVERTDTMRMLSKVTYEKLQKKKKTEWEDYRKNYIKEYKQNQRRRRHEGGQEPSDSTRMNPDGTPAPLNPVHQKEQRKDSLQMSAGIPTDSMKKDPGATPSKVKTEAEEYDEFVYDFDLPKQDDIAKKAEEAVTVPPDTVRKDTSVVAPAKEDVPADSKAKGKKPKKSRKKKGKNSGTADAAEGEAVKEKKSRKEKKSEKDEDIEVPPMPETFLEARFSQSNISPDQNIDIVFQEPIDTAYVEKFRFYHTVDSVDYDLPFLLRRVPGSVMRYRLYAEWQPDSTYILNVDTGAIVSMYGKRIAGSKKTIKVKSLEKFSQLTVNLHNTDPSAVVILLNQSGKEIKRQKAEAGKVDFFYVDPGVYYLQMFYDRNGDGKWTTGDYDGQLQPEETFFYPGELNLRAEWEENQDWNPTQTPLFKQKPEKITKQKPDKKKDRKSKNAEREEKKRKEK